MGGVANGCGAPHAACCPPVESHGMMLGRRGHVAMLPGGARQGEVGQANVSESTRSYLLVCRSIFPISRYYYFLLLRDVKVLW